MQFACPKCDAVLQIPDEYAGQRVGCNICQAKFALPPPPPMPEPVPEPMFEPTPEPAIESSVPAVNTGLADCKTCGKQVSRTAPTCPHCGENAPGLHIKCPSCGSMNISSGVKGFGLGKAAVGAVLLGPVGLLGGMMGRKKVELNCQACGTRWKPQPGDLA